MGRLTELRFIASQVRRTIRDWRSLYALKARFPEARVDADVRIVSPERLTLGAGVLLQRGVFLHCGGAAWSHGRGSISIGDRSVLSPYSILYGAGEITIGTDFDCGPSSMIFSSRSVYEQDLRGQGQSHHFEPVRIGNRVIVYAGCVIGPGVRVGDGAVIGAGSIVLDDVPESTLYAGTPARLIRELK